MLLKRRRRLQDFVATRLLRKGRFAKTRDVEASAVYQMRYVEDLGAVRM
jgi:hypothetical protein